MAPGAGWLRTGMTKEAALPARWRPAFPIAPAPRLGQHVGADRPSARRFINERRFDPAHCLAYRSVECFVGPQRCAKQNGPSRREMALLYSPAASVRALQRYVWNRG
jgi:hypothetical protein